jgi:hypothetical protein
MKLVNIHKQTIFLLFFLIGFQAAQAQVWTMQQCIDTAQVRNKNLQMSRNNVAIGEQKEKEAKANLIPKVTVNTDYKYFTNLPYQLMPLSTFNPQHLKDSLKKLNLVFLTTSTPICSCQCQCIIRKFTEQFKLQNSFGIDRITIPKN